MITVTLPEWEHLVVALVGIAMFTAIGLVLGWALVWVEKRHFKQAVERALRDRGLDPE